MKSRTLLRKTTKKIRIMIIIIAIMFFEELLDGSMKFTKKHG